ncbi:MAG TPA: LuxR family transcriptional regulator [Pseudonocardia sp.]
MTLRGRADARDRISAVLARARACEAQTVLIEGLPGSGKTVLLQDTAARAIADRWSVWHTSGLHGEVDLPLAALSLLLRTLKDLHALCAPLPYSQRRVLLAVAGQSGEYPVSDRFMLGAALLGLLTAAAETNPVLLAVDDAHWLDQASRDALGFAVHRLGIDRVAVVITSRLAERGIEVPHNSEYIELNGLDTTDLADMLADTAHPVSPPVAAAIGGLPLAARETARRLSPDERAGRTPLPYPLPIARDISASFARELANLPASARRAAALAALAGSAPASAVHSGLSALGLSRDDLAQVEDTRIVAVTAAGVRFRHPLGRAAAAVVGPDEQRTCHRALADALTDNPEAHALHLAAAATEPDETTAAALERAAAHTARRGGLTAAAPLLARAAALTAPGPGRHIRELAAARALHLAGNATDAITLAHRVLMDTTDGSIKVDASLALVAATQWTGQCRAALDTVRRITDALVTSEPVKDATLLAATAMATISLGDLRTAAAITDQLRTLLTAEVPASISVPEDVLAVLICLEVLVGNRERAVRDLQRWTSGRHDLLAANVFSLAMTSMTLTRLGRYDQARELCESLLEVSNRESAPTAKSFACAAAGDVHYWIGNWWAAVSVWEQGITLAEQTGQHALAPNIRAAAARVLGYQGRVHECRSQVAAALGSPFVEQFVPQRIYALATRGALELSTGEVSEAADTLVEADRIRRECGLRDPATAPFGPDLVEALLAAGRRHEARAAYQEHAELATNSGTRWARATMARCAALLAHDPDRAQALFAESVRLHPPEVVFDLAHTRLLWGESLHRRGDRTGAGVQLRAALAGFARLGARPWVTRTETGLKAVGESPRTRSGPDLGLLTAQEMHCALVVAQGMTNREAATALFVSQKTIEYHLSKIYAKLGITSRSQLTRIITSAQSNDSARGAL